MTLNEYIKNVNPNTSIGEYLRYAKDNDPEGFKQALDIFYAPLLNAYKNPVLADLDDE